VCWDVVANQIAKSRYMADGQVSFPLVIRTANGGGLRFGAQHSQSVENWAMAVPGLKGVAPSNPVDVIGLFAAAGREPGPVRVFEHKGLYASKAEVPDGEIGCVNLKWPRRSSLSWPHLRLLWSSLVAGLWWGSVLVAPGRVLCPDEAQGVQTDAF